MVKKKEHKGEGDGGHNNDITVAHFIGNLILVFIQDDTIPICGIRLCVCVEIWMGYNRSGRAQLDNCCHQIAISNHRRLTLN